MSEGGSSTARKSVARRNALVAESSGGDGSAGEAHRTALAAEPSPSVLRTSSTESRRLWGAAVAVALLALLLLIGLLSVNSEGGSAGDAADASGAPASKPQAAQGIGLQPIKAQQAHSEGDLVAGEALFFDPSPLFLPTRWNAGAGGMPETLFQEAEELFEDYAPKLRFAREGIGIGLLGNADSAVTSAVASASARASELVFSDEDSFGLSVIGRREEELARLPERGARLEVVATNANGLAATGALAEAALDVLTEVARGAPERVETAVARRVIVRDLVPPASFSGADNWRPLELAAVVDAVGLVGAVMIVQSSGVEAVDEFFRDYVMSQLHLGERVGPGVYRILAGP